MMSVDESRDIIFIQPNCGKYDLFIRDMPLGLIYSARMLDEKGYKVHIVDQRVLGAKTHDKLKELINKNPLWIGLTAMTGEPVYNALELCKFLRKHTDVPLVWGGIHPTILPDVTLQHANVDFIIRGKGERSTYFFTEALEGKRALKDVPGLTYYAPDGAIQHNEEDDEAKWGEFALPPYHLVDIDDYARVGFESRVFPIMTSRNCPHKCTFCYNASLPGKFRWLPDSNDYTRKHIKHILETYQPTYLSFIDDDFFVDRERAREILHYVEEIKPKHVKCGFRGVRVSDLRLLTDEDFDLLERINTMHLNIGIESGSDRILKHMKKGMRAQHAIDLNRRFKGYQFVPLYNFFSGIPGETEDDVKLSTNLILQLTKENPACQISGFHQYTPYPGNPLFDEAVQAGFPVPKNLEEWGDLKFEENARNCPWIDRKRKRLLDMIYCLVYFVDNKYDMYFSNNNWKLKALLPFVNLYKKIARFRMAHHFMVLPIEVWAKNLFYAIYYKPNKSDVT